ncbi:hypothetical protein [Anabaena sp. CCY 0017]
MNRKSNRYLVRQNSKNWDFRRDCGSARSFSSRRAVLIHKKGDKY